MSFVGRLPNPLGCVSAARQLLAVWTLALQPLGARLALATHGYGFNENGLWAFPPIPQCLGQVLFWTTGEACRGVLLQHARAGFAEVPPLPPTKRQSGATSSLGHRLGAMLALLI